MFMNIEISQSLLIDTVDSLKLLGFNFELYSRLSEIAIKLSLEISCVNHELIILFSFLLQLSLYGFQLDLSFIDGLL